MSLIENTNLNKLDLTKPYIIFPFFTLFFIILGISGFSLNSLVIYSLFFVAFYIGSYKASEEKSKSKHEWIWQTGKWLLLIGVVAELINFTFIGTVPLLEPQLKALQFPPLTMLSFLVVPGGLILFTKNLKEHRFIEGIIWFLLALFAISLTAFKTEIFVLLLSGFFVFYRFSKRRNFLNVLMIVGTIFLLVYLTNINYGLRASVTMGIFSSMSEDLTLFGESHGVLTQSIFSSIGLAPGPNKGPRGLISDISGIEGVTTTPTVLGIPYFDFGLVGIILLGLLFGYLFTKGSNGTGGLVPVHALNLSFLLLSIETGIGDIIVVFYLVLYAVMVGYEKWK